MRPSQIFLAVALAASVQASPVINEIMFHPAGTPEDAGLEWIELYNPDPLPAQIGGTQFTKGISYTLPAGTTMAPGSYLVVAADVAKFQAAYPGFTGTVVGGWTGRLSNSGEEIRLDDIVGNKTADVTYADEGDWALRARGPLSFGHRGWIWESPADGTGRSLERRNPMLSAESGQNWGASAVLGGTPGAVNTLASSNIAPLIRNPEHRPAIPRSVDPIVVSCELNDEGTAATATLRWRVGTGAWQSAPMTDADGGGRMSAVIPAQANLAIVEWYVEATDGVFSRTWPAPARTSDPGVMPEVFAQSTNALVQVDNAFSATATFRTPAEQPIYRLIMTTAERDELVQLQTTSGQEDSEATFHGTFISHDGTGLKVRYQCGFRNRGQGSALGPPNNYHVGFPSSDRWNGRSSFGLNCQYGYSQALGQALFARAGIATQESAIVRVRVNGADLAEAGTRMFGRYVRIEGRGGDWAENHYPLDPDGNFYRLDDHDTGGTNPPGDLGSGEFRYEGTDPNAYSDTFLKETNKDAFDYSDLVQFTKVVSAPVIGGTLEQPAISDAAYPGAVAGVLDLEQFYRFIATDALVGNQEGGLQSGRADDVSIYRGVLDPRFRFIPHDLDDVFDIGSGAGDPVNRSIFSYEGVVGLSRLFNHPELLPRYYAALLDATNAWFNRATVDPIVDQIMAGWVPATDGAPAAPNRGIAEIKAYVDARRANVLGQIQQNYSLTVTGNAADSAEGYKVTTTGAATFSGTFNVARTYSITVNGQLAQSFYRTVGADAAGTWKLVLAAGGGGVLNPGLNRVVVRFWDAPGGSGNVVQELQANVLFSAAGAGTTISGTLAPPGSLSMLTPATYVPGVPVLVRLDLKDANGELNRGAWNTTVNLSASNGVTLTPNTVTLYNGMGSALVTAGAGGGGTTTLLSYGTGGTGTIGSLSGTAGSTWKALVNLTNATIGSVPATWKDEGFDDSSWTSLPTRTGYGNSNNNWSFPITDYDPGTSGTQRGPSYLFRTTFDIADLAQVTSVTGQITFDDAYAIYVNGTFLARSSNLSPTATLSNYATGTISDNATDPLSIPLAMLKSGTNTIAVEIHQANSTSSDVTFNVRLQANLAAANPGNFTMTATAGGLLATKAMTSLAGVPETTVSGALPAGITNWSGVVRVTGDVTVPSGSTLNIAPGTHVLMTGTPGAGDTTGADLIVSGGTLAVNGTAAEPVSITASEASGRWGQIYLNGAQPTVCNYLLMSRGGHAPGQGHTSRGPMWRLNGAHLTLDDCAMGDGPAKALYSQGTCDFVMRRSLMARMITGPETEDGTSILIEDSNIQEILPLYRESNAPEPDDEDCLYVHNNSGRPVNVRRTVFARCGDDVFDCLGGPITVEDTILREGWDKGMSLLNNDLIIRRTLIVDCDKAIVPKSNSATTRTITVDRCTLVSENHDTTQAPWGYSIPPSSPDPDTPSTGLYTQNKSGQSHAGATLAITATNSIIIAESPILVDAPYDPVNTVVNYSITRDTDTPANAPWTGTGNSNADPLFVSLASDDYHLASGSPAINTGNPIDTDPDGTRADMGAYPTGVLGGGGGGGPAEVHWTLAGSPYHVTANTTVPANLTLRIHPGVSVYFSKGARLTVNGRLLALGSASQRIVFSHVPGTVDAGDCDPIKSGVQTGPPKWGGIRVYDSMAEENQVRYCDFINAQGTSVIAPENFGSIGFIRSWGWVDHCTWAGTHLRMCYGRNSKMTVTHNTFPDMFLFDPVLNRIENPTDFIASADNNQEPLKVEYPTGDPEVVGNPSYANGQPVGGHWRVYFNDFYGNRGHNDVFDADSGRWGQPGQFLLDCRYNHFHGLSGDEHIDLGGDAYIASNVFERATKDQWTSDTGYSNAISSGDKGSGTTIFVVRNLFFDLDHAINCKASTATIFEHNTVANFTPDFTYNGTSGGNPFTQDVKCAPVNFFIPEDGLNPTFGDGAYLGYNLISNVPRLFSGADARKVGGNVVNDITTKIEFYHNLLDQIGTTDIGPNHPGGIFGLTYGVNTAGAPGFVDEAADDFRLRLSSAARRSAPGGLDYGASVPEWAYILGGPVGTTAATSADFTIGGPGIVAYRWRLNGGSWSAPVQIGAGGVFPRTGATVRQATLNFTALANGTHTLEVIGQDAAGNWQDADPARNYDGEPQFAPTSRTWVVNTAGPLLRLSEVLANGSSTPDTVEIYNAGSAPVLLSGWFLTDDPAVPSKFPLPATSLAPGAYAAFTSSLLNLDKDGDSVYLFQGGTQRDSVIFGWQVLNHSIGRVVEDHSLVWRLGLPTFGAANTRVQTEGIEGVRISEWMASADARYEDDWVEISNSAAFPAALEGLRITDNLAGEPAQYVFPPLSFLAANGYVKLIADGNDELGHVPFSLDAEYETISLLRPDGTLLDTVAFYPQTTDFSSDRTGSFYELPTAGLPNNTVDANALALLRGLRVTEIMFNAIGGADYEYVELRNVGSGAFNLAGVRFVEGIDFTFGSIVLQPGENVIVCKHLARFRARYGDGPLVAGTYSGNLDNMGERLVLRLPEPFDASVLIFDYQDGWYPAADGDGVSLVVGSPATAPAGDWDLRETWNVSAAGGNPGGVPARSDTYSGWMTLHHALFPDDDDDHDSVPALVEFGLGMDPTSGLGSDGPLGLPVVSRNGLGQIQLTFHVPVNAAASGGHGFADASYEVGTSDNLSGWNPIASKGFGSGWTGSVSVGAAAGGFIPVTVTDTLNPVGTTRHIRLRVEWVP